jgi:hypothetical protein
MASEAISPTTSLLPDASIAACEGWHVKAIDGELRLVTPAEQVLGQFDRDDQKKLAVIKELGERDDIPRVPGVPNCDTAFCVDPVSSLGKAIREAHPELDTQMEEEKQRMELAFARARLDIGARRPRGLIPAHVLSRESGKGIS